MRLWDVDVAHARDRRSSGDVRRKQSECVCFSARFDLPPDRVASGAAGRECGLVAQRTVVSSDGGEHDGALVRLVAVLEHDRSLAVSAPADIGVAP
jgi:hypothetical protein